MNKTKEIIKSDGSLKQKIKELIKQVIDEITTSSAAGSGEGSAGVPRVPTWVSKKKNGRADLATKSLPGYTIAEKKGEKKSEKKDKPLVPVGKEKTPEEKAKSKIEAEQLYSDIKQAMAKQPEFDNFEQSQTKINQFIQS